MSFVRYAALALAVSLGTTVHAQKATTQQAPIGGLSFSPLIYRLVVTPGLSGTLDFNVASPSGKPAQASMRIVSATFDDWTYKARYGAANPRDCSAWFPSREASPVVSSKPLNQQFKFRVPTSARGSYYALLVFTPRPVGSNAGLNLFYEVPIMMQVGRTEPPDIKVAPPQVTGAASAAQVSVGFVNDGSGFGVVGAQCTLRSVLTGRKVAEVRVWDKNLYPHTKRRLGLAVSALPTGRYELSVSPEIGAKKLPDLVSYLEVKGQSISYTPANRLLSVAGVAVEPTGLEIAVPPGGSKLSVVRIRNTKSSSLTLSLSPTNVDQNASGAIGIGKSAPPSALAVTADPPELSLPPGGVKAVRLMVKADRSAAGDLWFGLKIGEKGVEGIPQQMLGVVSVKNTLRPQLAIESKGFEFARDGQPIKLNYVVRNTGNSGLQPRSVAGIVSGTRLVNTLAVPTLGDGGILPGATLQASVMLPLNLPPGRYEVQIKSRYSKTGVASLAVPFTIGRKP